MDYTLLFALALALVSDVSASSPPGEYDVKAAFLLNFARYVEWPPEVFHGLRDPLVICVLGQDPFGRALDDVVAGKTIEGRDVAVRRVADVRSADGCRVLFMSAGESKIRPATVVTPPAYGILTVGESDRKVSGDAVITFVIESGKVHFTINLVAAGRENLRLSSRLLGLASSVSR